MNYNRPNIKQAIDFIEEAWQSVTEKTIKNCWLHTKILPVEQEGKDPEINYQKLVSELDNCLNILRTNSDLVADLKGEEFVNIDHTLLTEEIPTNDAVVESTLIDSGIQSLNA